ncbi:MAG: DUF1653 domain-containing protein [Clostridiales bacterium]|nr:DUF1653 domain-containing protein [Clostridiales bacterium]
MRHNPKPQEMYRHFKGNLYQIRCLARHSETGEMMVVYQAMYDTFEIYVRPLAMFMEEVDRARYPQAAQKYRFELLQDMDSEEEAYQMETESEEANIDPLVMEFLEAETYEQRLNILAALHDRITDEMINTMAVAVDLEIKEGDVEERYEELKGCLLTFEKYECNRLR